MASTRYSASDASERTRWFQIEVQQEGDRWMATCREVDGSGKELTGGSSVAPSFYGLNEEQAHRKMLTALENRFSEVVEVRAEGSE